MTKKSDIKKLQEVIESLYNNSKSFLSNNTTYADCDYFNWIRCSCLVQFYLVMA